MPTKSWLGTFFTRNGLCCSYILAAVLAWIFDDHPAADRDDRLLFQL